jgi:hypothetical protein
MRGYRLELLDDENEWGIIRQEDGEDVPQSGVVRHGIKDALYWIQVQEDRLK